MCKINTEQDFIDYIAPYGTDIEHIFGKDCLVKTAHFTPDNVLNFKPNCIYNGKRYEFYFEINKKSASIKDCLELIKNYNVPKNRIDKLSKI